MWDGVALIAFALRLASPSKPRSLRLAGTACHGVPQRATRPSQPGAANWNDSRGNTWTSRSLPCLAARPLTSSGTRREGDGDSMAPRSYAEQREWRREDGVGGEQGRRRQAARECSEDARDFPTGTRTSCDNDVACLNIKFRSIELRTVTSNGDCTLAVCRGVQRPVRGSNERDNECNFKWNNILIIIIILTYFHIFIYIFFE